MSGAEDLTLDQLHSARTAAVTLLNSPVLFITDRNRIGDVITRIDEAVRLKHDRAAYRKEREGRKS